MSSIIPLNIEESSSNELERFVGNKKGSLKNGRAVFLLNNDKWYSEEFDLRVQCFQSYVSKPLGKRRCRKFESVFCLVNLEWNRYTRINQMTGNREWRTCNWKIHIPVVILFLAGVVVCELLVSELLASSKNSTATQVVITPMLLLVSHCFANVLSYELEDRLGKCRRRYLRKKYDQAYEKHNALSKQLTIFAKL